MDRKLDKSTLQHSKIPNTSLVLVSFIPFLPVYSSYYGGLSDKNLELLSLPLPNAPREMSCIVCHATNITDLSHAAHAKSREAKSARREWSKASAGRQKTPNSGITR